MSLTELVTNPVRGVRAADDSPRSYRQAADDGGTLLYIAGSIERPAQPASDMTLCRSGVVETSGNTAVIGCDYHCLLLFLSDHWLT